MQLKWYGQVEYSEALALQKIYLDQVIQHGGQANRIIGLEHPSCITLGHRAKPEKEIKPHYNNSNSNIPIIMTSRGGEATAHELGQLVIYPIVSLRDGKIGIREYVEILVNVTRNLLENMGINTTNKQNCPGVYTQNGKIASIGIRIKRGVAFHGIALNVSNTLETFELIRPCGEDYCPLDSIKKQTNKEYLLDDLFNQWNRLFIESFKIKSGR